jgi:hypothetical protein
MRHDKDWRGIEAEKRTLLERHGFQPSLDLTFLRIGKAKHLLSSQCATIRSPSYWPLCPTFCSRARVRT